MLPPLKPIAMKERVSMVFIQKGQVDVKDGAIVVIDETGNSQVFPTPVVMTRSSKRCAFAIAKSIQITELAIFLSQCQNKVCFNFESVAA